MWSEGDVVLRREVLNDGRCWCQFPVRVVQDNDELLATYIADRRGVRVPARRVADRERTAPVGRARSAGRATAC